MNLTFKRQKGIPKLELQVNQSAKIILATDDEAKRCYHIGKIDIVMDVLKTVQTDLTKLYQLLATIEAKWQAPIDIQCE